MLSAETIQKLKDAQEAILEYRTTRVAEIEDLVTNIKAYGVSLDALSTKTTEVAASDALSTIEDLLG